MPTNLELCFTTRQLLGAMLAISLLLAVAAPLGWLGAIVLGISLPVATYVAVGTLFAYRMSRVTSLAVTVFVTSLVVVFALGLLEGQIRPQLLRLRVPLQALQLVAMAVSSLVWLMVYLTKRKKGPGVPSSHMSPAASTEDTSGQ